MFLPHPPRVITQVHLPYHISYQLQGVLKNVAEKLDLSMHWMYFREKDSMSQYKLTNRNIRIMLDQHAIYHISSCVIAILLLSGFLCHALQKEDPERNAEMELLPDNLSLLTYTGVLISP